MNPGARSAKAEVQSGPGGALSAKAGADCGVGSGPEALYAARGKVEAAILAAAVGTRGLSPARLAAEVERRREVFVALNAARFPGAMDEDKRAMPERVCRLLCLAPWVTPKMARGHAWDARRLTAEARAKGVRYNPVGYVIAMCGASARTLGVPEPTSVFFEDAWRRSEEARARAVECASARSVPPEGGVAHA